LVVINRYLSTALRNYSRKLWY